MKRSENLVKLRRDAGRVGSRILSVMSEIGECFLDGLFEAMKPPNMNFARYSGQYHLLYKSVRRLEQKGFLETTKEGKKISIRLTKSGTTAAGKIEMLNLKITRLRVWDGIWRCVIFDIPEDHKVVREMVRKKLKELGFVQMQKSVFIIPWPCKEIVSQIQEIYGVHQYIKYMEVTSFDEQETYAKRFDIHPV